MSIINLADDDKSQFDYDSDLTLQARRRKRRNLGEDELFLPELVPSSTISLYTTPLYTTPNSLISSNYCNYGLDRNFNLNTETSLVHKPHSDLAVAVSSIAAVTKIGLDIASVVSNVYLETAKFSTKASLDIARTVTGALSERMVQVTSLEGCGGR